MREQLWQTGGEIMKEQAQSLSTTHGRAIMHDKSWRRNRGGQIIENHNATGAIMAGAGGKVMEGV